MMIMIMVTFMTRDHFMTWAGDGDVDVVGDGDGAEVNEATGHDMGRWCLG